MQLERAVVYVLSEEEPKPPTLVAVLEQQQPQPPADEPSERLTAREREVALLVGRGLTNRQIAKEFSISKRTAEHHVARILKRLGLHSRAQRSPPGRPNSGSFRRRRTTRPSAVPG